MKKTTFLLLAILFLLLITSCSTFTAQLTNTNEYFLEWSYCDSDKVLRINKNSGIFVFSTSGDPVEDRLFEVSLKKELQAKGYNNIILASYCTDFDPETDDCFGYAFSSGCEFIVGFGFEKSWSFENGGGLASSSSICYLYDIKSIFSNSGASFDYLTYDFIVSANNHFQSYDASLVTFNSFITKQIMKEISIHLIAEENADSQAFFEYGQSGAIKDYFKDKE